MPVRHLYACLVHEQPACVQDLVRNLRALDADSAILLYNGGTDPELLAGPELEAYDVFVHPAPQPQRWGQLHGFALDCFRHALTLPDCEAITIVDSDQLCVMRNYGAALLSQLATLGPDVGVLSNKPKRVSPDMRCCEPVDDAFREWPRFAPFVSRFAVGEAAWVHHTFWPGTVFTRAAAKALTQLFEDPELQALVAGSKMFATEETLLPSFSVMLGLRVCRNPFHDKFVKFRLEHNAVSADMAILRKDIAFIHPVPRVYDDPVRQRIRERFGGYARREREPERLGSG